MADSKSGLKNLVITTLRAVCEDPAAPAAARAQAARTLAEIDGMLGKHQAPPAKDLETGEDMSEADIDAEIRRLRRQAALDEATFSGD